MFSRYELGFSYGPGDRGGIDGDPDDDGDKSNNKARYMPSEGETQDAPHCGRSGNALRRQWQEWLGSFVNSPEFNG